MAGPLLSTDGRFSAGVEVVCHSVPISDAKVQKRYKSAEVYFTFVLPASANKTELIDRIAAFAGLSKAAAVRISMPCLQQKTTLKKNGLVALVECRAILVAKRAARTSRNPGAGYEIKIKTAKVPEFKSGKESKDAVRYCFWRNDKHASNDG